MARLSLPEASKLINDVSAAKKRNSIDPKADNQN